MNNNSTNKQPYKGPSLVQKLFGVGCAAVVVGSCVIGSWFKNDIGSYVSRAYNNFITAPTAAVPSPPYLTATATQEPPTQMPFTATASPTASNTPFQPNTATATLVAPNSAACQLNGPACEPNSIDYKLIVMQKRDCVPNDPDLVDKLFVDELLTKMRATNYEVSESWKTVELEQNTWSSEPFKGSDFVLFLAYGNNMEKILDGSVPIAGLDLNIQLHPNVKSSILRQVFNYAPNEFEETIHIDLTDLKLLVDEQNGNKPVGYRLDLGDLIQKYPALQEFVSKINAREVSDFQTRVNYDPDSTLDDAFSTSRQYWRECAVAQPTLILTSTLRPGQEYTPVPSLTSTNYNTPTGTFVPTIGPPDTPGPVIPTGTLGPTNPPPPTKSPIPTIGPPDTPGPVIPTGTLGPTNPPPGSETPVTVNKSPTVTGDMSLLTPDPTTPVPDPTIPSPSDTPESNPTGPPPEETPSADNDGSVETKRTRRSAVYKRQEVSELYQREVFRDQDFNWLPKDN